MHDRVVFAASLRTRKSDYTLMLSILRDEDDAKERYFMVLRHKTAVNIKSLPAKKAGAFF